VPFGTFSISYLIILLTLYLSNANTHKQSCLDQFISIQKYAIFLKYFYIIVKQPHYLRVFDERAKIEDERIEIGDQRIKIDDKQFQYSNAFHLAMTRHGVKKCECPFRLSATIIFRMNFRESFRTQ